VRGRILTSDYDESKDYKVRFVMSEPARNERLEVFGPRYRVWQLILQTLTSRGFVNGTQREISIRAGIQERAVQKHFTAFKQAGMLEKKRDPDGRMKFWVAPEHYWNYKLHVRNRKLAERCTHLSEDQLHKMSELGIEVIEGGKK